MLPKALSAKQPQGCSGSGGHGGNVGVYCTCWCFLAPGGGGVMRITITVHDKVTQ
jgi:hypothetical protein